MRGAPKGRRPLIWICSDSPIEKFIIQDKEPDTEEGNFPQEEAVNAFKAKYGKEPTYVSGPFYDKKGTKKPNKKRDIARQEVSEIILTTEQKPATINGWHGIANMLKDNEKQAYFIFLREVNPDPKKKHEPPKPGVVNLTDLHF